MRTLTQDDIRQLAMILVEKQCDHSTKAEDLGLQYIRITEQLIKLNTDIRSNNAKNFLN